MASRHCNEIVSPLTWSSCGLRIAALELHNVESAGRRVISRHFITRQCNEVINMEAVVLGFGFGGTLHRHILLVRQPACPPTRVPPPPTRSFREVFGRRTAAPLLFVSPAGGFLSPVGDSRRGVPLSSGPVGRPHFLCPFPLEWYGATGRGEECGERILTRTCFPLPRVPALLSRCRLFCQASSPLHTLSPSLHLNAAFACLAVTLRDERRPTT